MTQQYPYIQQLNRQDPVVAFGQLPEYYQEFIKVLWRAGVIIEVFGVKSRQWQPLTQHNASWERKKFYRLKGDMHYACQKPGRTHNEREIGVYVTDPTALPQNTICYMADGYALSATVTPY